jgi:hypothetical protein
MLDINKRKFMGIMGKRKCVYSEHQHVTNWWIISVMKLRTKSIYQRNNEQVRKCLPQVIFLARSLLLSMYLKFMNVEKNAVKCEYCNVDYKILTWNVILIVWARGRVHAKHVPAKRVPAKRVNFGSRQQARGGGRGSVAFVSLLCDDQGACALRYHSNQINT